MVRGLGINMLTSQPPWAYCKLLGDIEVTIVYKEGRSNFPILRGANEYQPKGWRWRQPKSIPMPRAADFVLSLGM